MIRSTTPVSMAEGVAGDEDTKGREVTARFWVLRFGFWVGLIELKTQNPKLKTFIGDLVLLRLRLPAEWKTSVAPISGFSSGSAGGKHRLPRVSAADPTGDHAGDSAFGRGRADAD